MDKKWLRGKRFIALVRVSNAKETDNPAEAQLKLLRSYGDEHEMVFVDHIDESDVSGSFPVRREKLENLIARKRRNDDFDVLLCQRLDRLTRSGPDHGFWFEHECKRAGIKLIFVADDIPDGAYAGLIKVAKWEGSREQALATSQRSTQGYQYAVEKGTCITSSRTPYGCWRMYFSGDGQPSHIIRDLRDGRQEKLDPHTHQRIATLGEIADTKARGRYKKQKQERPLLMPGDLDQVGVVREIFDLHYRQGIGSKRIADILNARGTPSPNRRKWSQNQVESIYSRECYTGRSVGNRTTSAKFYCRNRDAPKPANIDEDLATQRKYLPKRERPLEEWVIQEQPLMLDFLDPHLRELAIKGQEEFWHRRLDPTREKRVLRRSGSNYLLTGLLQAKQDGELLVGVLCGRPTSRIRYYRHRRGAREYRKGSPFNRMFLSEPLEQNVVAFVQDALTNAPDLDERIQSAIRAQLDRLAHENIDVTALIQKRDEIRKRFDLAVSSLDEATLLDAKASLARMRAEIQTLDQQIEVRKAIDAIGEIDTAAVAERVRERCLTLASALNDAPPRQLRELLRLAVEKVVADMETKAIEIHLTLPNWIMEEAPCCPMRPGTISRSSVGPPTHLLPDLKIAVGHCQYALRSSRACYDCERRRAA